MESRKNRSITMNVKRLAISAELFYSELFYSELFQHVINVLGSYRPLLDACFSWVTRGSINCGHSVLIIATTGTSSTVPYL